MNKPKESVIILPYVEDKVLMQLRDFKEDIIFPGCWGFFGGGIEEGETPEYAAERELLEEISYKPDFLNELGRDEVPDLDGLILYSFYFQLTVPVEDLKLTEGCDLGIFSLEEIISGKLYSNKLKDSFPTVSSTYMVSIIRKLLNKIR